MPRVNDFLPFALGPSENVLSQSDWLALAARATGFETGVAKSEEANKAWRQALFTAAVLWEYVGQRLNANTPDDGDVTAAVARLASAVVSAAGGLEVTVNTDQAVGAANNRAYYVNTVAVTYTLAASASLATSFRASIHALGGNATLAINGADAINGGTAGAGLTIPRGFIATVTADGANGILVAMVKVQKTVTTLSANATLRSDQAGLVLLDTSSASFTATLPVGANLKDIAYEFVKVSSDANVATIARNGSDIIVDSVAPTGMSPNFNLQLAAQNEAVTLVSDGASPTKWQQLGGAKLNLIAAKLRTGLSNVVVTSAQDAYLATNADLAPDGTWNRQNTSQPASAIHAKRDGTFELLTAAAGANPIGWTSLAVWSNGTAISGDNGDNWSGILPRNWSWCYLPNGRGFRAIRWAGPQIGWSLNQGFSFSMPSFPANPYVDTEGSILGQFWNITAQGVVGGATPPILTLLGIAGGNMQVQVAVGSASSPNSFNVYATQVF